MVLFKKVIVIWFCSVCYNYFNTQEIKNQKRFCQVNHNFYQEDELRSESKAVLVIGYKIYTC